MIVRKFLFAKGLRYRLHSRKLSGKPDIILPRFKTVIFVHGCFWHGHNGCRYYVIPKTRTEYWSAKIGRNIIKDVEHQSALKQAGWRVIVIWECDLKQTLRQRTLEDLLSRVLKQ